MPYAKRVCQDPDCDVAGGRSFQPESSTHDTCTPCRVKRRGAKQVVVVPPQPAHPPEEADLRGALNRALRALDRVKASKEELVRAVYQAASDGIAALVVPPVPNPAKDERKKASEVAIAVLADWQLGKRTETYSSADCEKRIEEYARKVIKLTGIQRTDHPVKELRVYLLGDLVEGELIFPGQSHLTDASLYRQMVLDGPRILGNFLRTMLANFEKVHVVGVIGNHGSLGGRARKDYHPESNADAMLYEVTRQLLQGEERLTWAPNSKPGERNWYAVDRVGSKAFFLFHGDQIQGGFAGFPWYGFGKKIMGWRMGSVPEPFDYSLSGHFHTPVRFLVGGITHWGSGSPESSNTYAAEMLAAQGTPSQWLLFTHPDRGITCEYQVHLGAKA